MMKAPELLHLQCWSSRYGKDHQRRILEVEETRCVFLTFPFCQQYL